MQDISRLSPSVQNYLKAIYEISAEGKEVNTGEIAERLGISPASVSNMLQRLTGMEPPLIDYLKHRSVKLTEQGEQAALRLIRRHRLIELFLIEVLGYSWEEVHPEAEELEHAISEKLERHIANLLGDPLFGPNGKPIPTASLEMPKNVLAKLTALKAGQKGIIRQINDRNPDLLRYLEKVKLTPQTRIEVVENLPFDDKVCVRIAEQESPVCVGPAVASQIMVDVSE
jgi:DtxR family transcriptional regulator, Mn-dependent transcriptional regulator